MTNGNDETRTRIGISEGTDNAARKQPEETLLKAGALQSAIFNSANFSSIATDAKGVIQIFNVGAERMLGYAAAEVMNKITPADISDPQELIARATALSIELGTPITPGFEALVFKASRGIEDIYELTYIRKDGSRFPAVVSVTALRDAQGAIIGYLLIGTDNTARKQVEAEQKTAEAEVSRKNKELAALSGKLAKYLSPQVYNSIFTGAQSVEIASNRKKLTVFFTDIYLKTAVLGGCELALQAIKLRPDLRVLYTTGNTITEKMKALFVEGTHFLRKPYTQHQLQHSVEDLLTA